MRDLDADTQVIASTIGGDLARRMLAAGYPADVVFDEASEACNLAADILDRETRAAASPDPDQVALIRSAVDHFRRLLRLRLPDDVDLLILAGDVPAGVRIVARAA